MRKLLLVLLVVTLLVGCNNDDDSGQIILPDATLSVNFNQVFDGNPVGESDFGSTVFVNELGHEMMLNRVRYLISRIVLTDDSSGETYEIPGYQLIDMADPTTFNMTANFTIPQGDYRVSFVYGFNEEDNQDGAYPDLNAVSWNWPMMLGGGYHFLQMDGTYVDSAGDTQPFNYHNGTARVSDGVFEQNFLVVDYPDVFEVDDEDDTIRITMDIAEWFRNPYTWDLEVYNTPLMPNYDAQKLMNQNASTVFSVSIN